MSVTSQLPWQEAGDSSKIAFFNGFWRWGDESLIVKKFKEPVWERLLYS